MMLKPFFVAGRCGHLRSVVTSERPNLNDAGTQELKALITECMDVFEQRIGADRVSVLPYRRWRG
jgi:hypothetical protein